MTCVRLLVFLPGQWTTTKSCRARAQLLVKLLGEWTPTIIRRCCHVTMRFLPCTTRSWILQSSSSIVRLYRCIKFIQILHVAESQIRTVLNPNPRLSPLMVLPSYSSPPNLLKSVPLSIRLFKRFPPSRSHINPLSPIPPYGGTLLGPRSPPKYLAIGEVENRCDCPRWTRWESRFSRPLPLSPHIYSLGLKIGVNFTFFLPNYLSILWYQDIINYYFQPTYHWLLHFNHLTTPLINYN